MNAAVIGLGAKDGSTSYSKTSLICDLGEFIDLVSSYSGDNPKMHRMVLKMLKEKKDNLEKLWDQSLNSKYNFEKCMRLIENHIGTEVQADVVAEKFSEADAPEAVIYFHKFSPYSRDRILINCALCTKSVGSVRSLNDHIKSTHPDRKDLLLHEVKGTCYLPNKTDGKSICGQKFATHQIGRHIKVSTSSEYVT